MDQEPTKRRRGRKTVAGDQPAEEKVSAEAGKRVSEQAETRNLVQKVQQDPLNDPRTAIADALSAYLTPEQTERLVDEILAIHKRVPIRVECTYCGKAKNEYVEIPDAKAVVSALTSLLDNGFGRPDVAKMERDMITFQRFTDFDGWEAANEQ